MKRKVDVLIGLQWGDEGKGKVVDVLAPHYRWIARFQGGPNAGHSLVFDGKKHVLHTVPSGIFHPSCGNIIGNGVVIDPITFQKEIDGLINLVPDIHSRILISRKTHLILPTHRLLDAASERAKGKEKIGSTLKGIGPVYMDKTGRNGLRVGDLQSVSFLDKYRALVNKHLELLSIHGEVEDFKNDEQRWMESIEQLKKFTFIDSEQFINDAINRGEAILAEGAQGAMLDIDFGTYPFVTSSNTVTAGACTGLGIPPQAVGRVIGIFKAYCTRVGSGPFPTELNDETGELIRQTGSEFGSTTGRPRRCGWIDLPALRYSMMINGVTDLAMMKADVLSCVDTVKACTAYSVNGVLHEHIPYALDHASLAPEYVEFQGWINETLSAEAPLPESFTDYLNFLKKELNLPVSLISLGPDRKETIIRGDFAPSLQSLT